jgi:hypothetical protein
MSLALVPLVRVFAEAPGWVKPSMITGSPMMLGRLVWGEMVFTPVPGMSNSMVSSPATALASLMAALRVHRFPAAKSASQTPSPMFTSARSLAELTVKVVEACAGPAAVSIIASPASIISAPR